MKIKQVYIIITPYQYKVMKRLFEETIFLDSSLIFHTAIVNVEKNLHLGPVFTLEFINFSLDNLKKSPFKYVHLYRKEFKKIRNFVNGLLKDFSLNKMLKIHIGTDKDNFTQIFLNYIYGIKNIKKELIAVEEGSGFYRKERNKDKFMAALYAFMTPILFSEKIRYHKQLGTDNRINKVYARLPESIPKSKNSKKREYLSYSLKSTKEFDASKASGVLIFSFPNRNYSVSDQEQIEVLQILVDRLGKNQKVWLKPHPREPLDVVNAVKNVILLNQTNSGEDLDYFQYRKIVNFNSSIVIDLLESGYPKERIYTINLDDSDISFFEETNYIGFDEIYSHEF